MQTASPRAIVIACAAFAAGAALALFGFGPLDPPEGPISPTYKTLSEVEPRTAINATNTPGDADSRFKITKPGSYYLPGNITGVSGKSGIEVTANCTIDLCGFELKGVNGSLDGILLTGEFRGTVRNGQVFAWGRNGIAAEQCDASLFEDLSIDGSGAAGITVGLGSTLNQVRASNNKAEGIKANSFCTIADCTASGNLSQGIDAGSFSTVSRCTARYNNGAGIQGYEGVNISDCVSAYNGSVGIAAGGGIVRDSVCDGNPTANILINNVGGAILRGNTCSNSAKGIYCVSGSNYVEANLLRYNELAVVLPGGGHNLMVRNQSVSKEGAYNVGDENDYGKLLFSPGDNFSSFEAWANFDRRE
jgi:hypothetical protein